MNNKSNKDEKYDEQNKSMSLNEEENKNKLEPGEENVKDLNKSNDINMNNQEEENKKNNEGENNINENNENKVDSNEKNINEEKNINNDNNNKNEKKLDDLKNILEEDGDENDSKLCKINIYLSSEEINHLNSLKNNIWINLENSYHCSISKIMKNIDEQEISIITFNGTPKQNTLALYQLQKYLLDTINVQANENEKNN